MYITRDYLKVGSWQAIIDMINDTFNFQLHPGVVKLKEMTKLGPKRTRIEIIPNRSTNPINLMPEITETVFTYDRLNCTEFFRNTIAVDVSGLTLPISTFDILKQIGDRNEIVFEVDDFIHQTFDHYSGTTENDFIIEADERSLRFVGHLRVRLKNTTKVDLNQYQGRVFAFPEITVAPTAGIIDGDYYTNRYDFTEWRQILKDVPVGLWHHGDLLSDIIQKATLTHFDHSVTPSFINLTNEVVEGVPMVKVLYNGAPTPQWTSREQFNHILVLELSPTYCQGMSGFLRLHYD
uniref:Virion structural protein n=1 Tax=Pseudomonas phage RVTF4 TaxID=3236931 RepID=A0AB39CD67_9VIRU